MSNGLDHGRSLRSTYAWWNTTIAVGSSFLASTVDRAVTPKPCDKVSSRTALCGKEGANEGNIVHTKHNNTLVLGRVFRYSPKMCFYDMVSIQEWHFTVRFDPDLEGRELLSERNAG